MWLRVGLCIAVLCLPGWCGAQVDVEPDTLSGYVDLEAIGLLDGVEATVDLSLRSPMLHRIGAVEQKENPRLAEALLGLQLIRAQTFQAKKADSLKAVMAGAARYLDALDWETAVRSRKKHERVSVFLKTENGEAMGVLVMVLNTRKSSSLSVVNLMGNVDLAQVSRIRRRFDLDALRRVGKLMPGIRQQADAREHTHLERHIRLRKDRHRPITNVWGPDDDEGLWLRYNRVDGAFLGWRLPLQYRSTQGLAHFGEAGYGFGGEQVRYRAGLQGFSFYGTSGRHMVALGGEVHDLTDTQDDWLVADVENSAYSLFFKRDFRDYYRRLGGSVYALQDMGDAFRVTGRMKRDRFESLPETVSWSLFSRGWGRSEFRLNPPVKEGVIQSVEAKFQLDTRNRKEYPTRGWLGQMLLERAGGFMKGEYQFERYLLDIRRYQPVVPHARLDVRLRLGTGRGILPEQYLYDLGGLSSIRGYGYKAFTGDRMVLFNMVYWVDGDKGFRGNWPLDDLDVGIFFDAGYAWFADDNSDLFDGVNLDMTLKKSAGLALTVEEDFHVYLAKPLNTEDNRWTLSVRFSRAF